MRRPLAFVVLAVAASAVLVGTPSAAPPPTTPRGDITAVNAGSGIKISSTPNPPGDGSTGDVTVSLRDCASGEVLKSGGPGSWSCAADSTGAPSTGTSSVAAEEATTSTTCGDLATVGPSVTVNAPMGLISVFAEFEAKGEVDGTSYFGARVCMQVGANPPVTIMQEGSCGGCVPPPRDFTKWQTQPGTAVGPFQADRIGGWLAVPVSGPGPHTVKLSYASGGEGRGATFRNRKLWVMGIS